VYNIFFDIEINMFKGGFGFTEAGSEAIMASFGAEAMTG
jgi:hypothetical protein